MADKSLRSEADRILAELREEGAREKITVVKGSKINKKSFTKTIGTNTLERRIGNNEKKITSLKKILQFKKTNIGDNLRDIGQDSENPKNNPLGSLKKGLGAILKTIGGIGKSINSGIKSDKKSKEKKRVKADRLKKKSRADSLGKTDGEAPEKEKKENPAANILGKIGTFFKNILIGTALLSLLNWLKNPTNMKRVEAVLTFLSKHGDTIFKGLVGIAGLMIGRRLFMMVRGATKFLRTIGVLRKVPITKGRGGSLRNKVGSKNPFKKTKVTTSGGFKKGPLSGIRKGLSKLNPFKSSKVTSSASKAITSNVTESVTKKVSKTAGKQILKKTAAKGMGKAFMKKIPFVGLALGLGFGIDRLRKGDWGGALLEMGSGAASMFPGIGTGVSLAADAALIAKDAGVVPEQEKPTEKKKKINSSGLGVSSDINKMVNMPDYAQTPYAYLKHKGLEVEDLEDGMERMVKVYNPNVKDKNGKYQGITVMGTYPEKDRVSTQDFINNHKAFSIKKLNEISKIKKDNIVKRAIGGALDFATFGMFDFDKRNKKGSPKGFGIKRIAGGLTDWATMGLTDFDKRGKGVMQFDAVGSNDKAKSISQKTKKSPKITVVPIDDDSNAVTESGSSENQTEVPSSPSTSGVEDNYTSSVYGLLGGFG